VGRFPGRHAGRPCAGHLWRCCRCRKQRPGQHPM